MSVVGPVSSARGPRRGIGASLRRSAALAGRSAVWLLLATSSGCAAIRAQVEIQGAIDAQRAADPARTAELAPYEHTMATRYLQKAWEELGSREYRATVDLARTSREWSELAGTTAGRAEPTDLVDAAPTVRARVVPATEPAAEALPEPVAPPDPPVTAPPDPPVTAPPDVTP